LSQVEVSGNELVQKGTIWLETYGQHVNHHYYSRFIAEETELWFFGCGLGEQAIFDQMGAAFLEECAAEDPCLGRIIISAGLSATAHMVYKGDWNLWWAFGDHDGWALEHFSKTFVQPQMLLCASDKVAAGVRYTGLPILRFPFAVGKLFKPLNLERKGLGYAGNPIKSSDQYHILVEPFIARADFEWISKNAGDKYRTLAELNEWYNTKQIVFGMAGDGALKLDTPPNRFYETLASGTPFITAQYDTLKSMGFQYPFMSDCPEKTVWLVETILHDYPDTLKLIVGYSHRICKFHNYNVRVKTLFEALEHVD
jgi:hypothetical protein